jgi:hypothetical protein
MKAHEKKKAYNLACKRKIRQGLINSDQGDWASEATVKARGLTDSTINMIRKGNRER